jgi:hypothetical protein
LERLFIQTQTFSDHIKEYKNSNELLIDVEQGVLKDLKKLSDKRDVISGTGGFTKIRVALKAEKRGKSGSLRVIYFDCDLVKSTFLIMIYSKSSFENISKAGKNALKQLGQELKLWQAKKIK